MQRLSQLAGATAVCRASFARKSKSKHILLIASSEGNQNRRCATCAFSPLTGPLNLVASEWPAVARMAAFSAEKLEKTASVLKISPRLSDH
jgi:hypothetical protein